MRKQFKKWLMKPVEMGDFYGCLVRVLAMLLVCWGLGGVIVYAGLKLILWATA